LKSAYEQVLAEWQATPIDQRTTELGNKLSAARTTFDAFGKTTEGASLRIADRRLRALLGYDYSELGRRAQDTFKRQTMDSNGVAARSAIYPSLPSLVVGAGWLTVNFVLSTADPPQFGYTPPLHQYWCCGTAELDGQVIVTKIQFEMAKTIVSRPWLDGDAAFGAGRNVWRFGSDSPKLSEGVASTDDNWSGPLTYMPQEFVFARQLHLSIPDDARVYRAIQTAIEGKSSLRFGPFAVSGRFDGATGPVEVVPYLAGPGMLVVPQVQLIGTLGTIMPPAPDPRSDLVWRSPLPALPVN